MSPLSTLTRSKPFYVAAGAGDLAVKKLRELPTMLQDVTLVAVKLDKDELAKAVTQLQTEAVSRATVLPAKAQTVAVQVATETVDKTEAIYTELLTRGRQVVGRIRRQKSTQELKREAATTVRRTRAASTTAREAASDIASAGKATTTTARRSAKKAASSTRTSAKRTTTTARKRTAATKRATAAATKAAAGAGATAAKATQDAAGKVGN